MTSRPGSSGNREVSVSPSGETLVHSERHWTNDTVVHLLCPLYVTSVRIAARILPASLAVDFRFAEIHSVLTGRFHARVSSKRVREGGPFHLTKFPRERSTMEDTMSSSTFERAFRTARSILRESADITKVSCESRIRFGRAWRKWRLPVRKFANPPEIRERERERERERPRAMIEERLKRVVVVRFRDWANSISRRIQQRSVVTNSLIIRIQNFHLATRMTKCLSHLRPRKNENDTYACIVISA